MKFYHITNDTKDANNASFKAACAAKDIQYIALDPETHNYVDGVMPQEGDLIYRTLTYQKAVELEWRLMEYAVTTLHSDELKNERTYRNQSRVFAAKNIPIPKTVRHATNNRECLESYSVALGGFPLILKVWGSYRGAGIVKIESLDSLFSTADLLVDQGIDFYLLEFIPVNNSARLIVLGDEVIGSIEYQGPDDDFRSIAEGVTCVPMDYDSLIHRTAIEATQAIGSEFGGVDILIDNNKNLYVTEVNFPCFFPRVEQVTGIDIAGQIIDYLTKKYEQRSHSV